MTSGRESVILVAASGLARETAEAVHAAGGYELAGFVDDNPQRWGTEVDGLPVLGGLEAISARSSARIVLCPGPGWARRRLAHRLAAAGVPEERYATIIHPTAAVARSSEISPGCVLLAGVVLTASVRLGRHVVIMPNTVLTHDDVVDDYATLCASVSLAGSARVGSGAYVGAGALVREGVAIGAWSTLGMGAVALRDVPDGEVWVGNPARFLRRAALPGDQPSATSPS
ncbi:sugar O-acyltransferase, sialic acid O-acetyltransferase NeuD family [Parafrankia irregularis]|uniref:Sugar O-acyltransferase, sialic acid O-acetyltransferase NeuD family n=1 Tax=Parafrankia irregularis TaxID=795642 RepID=A0A0S4QT94_9ACTN|nr:MULTISPECIES: acetyltransferase [Parafrankia]MBE3204992.1 acetyltransferase [Parafrankia sp. CH37]CUU58532.1 sugar O-acyltransferase, sialic acid O-acetyltransferase NeuD family [Parafrankia irregularis]